MMPLSEERRALEAAANLARAEFDELRKQTRHNRWLIYALAVLVAGAAAIGVGVWRITEQQQRDREAACAQANSARQAVREFALRGDLVVVDGLAEVVSASAAGDAERLARIEQQRQAWVAEVTAATPPVEELARLDRDCNEDGELGRDDYMSAHPDGLPVTIPED